ncbi:hypothetical protein pb186bvf_019678 [Paramecium bursaria]
MDQIEDQQEENKFQVIVVQIFNDPENKNNYKPLKEYITANKPSYNMIENLFIDAIKDLDHKVIGQKLYFIINELIQINIQRVFLRILYNYIQARQDLFDFNYELLKQQGFQKLWDKQRPEEIQQFIQLFRLEVQQQEVEKLFLQLTKSKKYDDAFHLFKTLNLNMHCFQQLMAQMNNNSDAGKAAEFINRQNYDVDLFPNIVERLEKQSSRYIQNNYKWQQAEEMLIFRKQTLAYLCEDYYFGGKNKIDNNKQIACSIIKRNDLLPLIKKDDIKQQIIQDLDALELIPNDLFTRDIFGPTEIIFDKDSEQVYIKLQDLNQQENQIVFINEDGELLNMAYDHLICQWRQNLQQQKNSEERFYFDVGVDSEFISSDTKLDKKGVAVQILQISSFQYTFIFDLVFLQKVERFRQLFVALFEDFEIQKSGQAFSEDLKILSKFLNIEQLVIILLIQICRNYIDIGNTFKHLNGDSSVRNLAFISQQIIGKPISKFEQCSNWAIRPLRKAQIHYAAMDSLIQNNGKIRDGFYRRGERIN